MKLEDINHIAVQRSIISLQIDIEPFKDYKELREYLKKNKGKFYRKQNAEYFKKYMRDRYRKKHGIVPLTENNQFKEKEDSIVDGKT